MKLETAIEQVKKSFICGQPYAISNRNPDVRDASSLRHFPYYDSGALDKLLGDYFVGMKTKVQMCLQAFQFQTQDAQLEMWFLYFLRHLKPRERTKYSLFCIRDLDVPRICENLDDMITAKVVYTSPDSFRVINEGNHKFKLTMYNYARLIVDIREGRVNEHILRGCLTKCQEPPTIEEVRTLPAGVFREKYYPDYIIFLTKLKQRVQF